MLLLRTQGEDAVLEPGAELEHRPPRVQLLPHLCVEGNHAKVLLPADLPPPKLNAPASPEDCLIPLEVGIIREAVVLLLCCGGSALQGAPCLQSNGTIQMAAGAGISKDATCRYWARPRHVPLCQEDKTTLKG